MLYIGIDLGTSAVKLLLMDASGKICKTVSRAYPLSFPAPGWSEQAPEDWLRQTLDGMAELVANCDRSSVAGIGIGGQMHGLVALDVNDQVIRPAILWNDGRTAAETEWLNEEIGRTRLTCLLYTSPGCVVWPEIYILHHTPSGLPPRGFSIQIYALTS